MKNIFVIFIGCLSFLLLTGNVMVSSFVDYSDEKPLCFKHIKDQFRSNVKFLSGNPHFHVSPLVSVFSSYIGGSREDNVYDMEVDKQGNLYLCGFTYSKNFPTVNAFQESRLAYYEGFVTKIAPSGDHILFSTYFGGSDISQVRSIAVDEEGYIYVTGFTYSNDFPLKNSFQSINQSEKGTAFVSKFTPNGEQLVYSTYLGGTSMSEGISIAVDKEGRATVMGAVWGGSDFPVLNAYQDSCRGEVDLFITRLSPSGKNLIFSTYLGGSGYDYEADMALDSYGNVYVCGRTYSLNYPTVQAFQTENRGYSDGFVSKLSTLSNSLVFSTYLGGKANDSSSCITVDPTGNVYLTGWTMSDDFPIQDAFQDTPAGSCDIYVASLTGDGKILRYSTFLGGKGSEEPHALTVDANGIVFVTGYTESSDFPVYRGSFDCHPGTGDIFLTLLSHKGDSLLLSTLYGGSNNDFGDAITINSQYDIYLTGVTVSEDFPVNNAFQPFKKGGISDCFITKFYLSEPIMMISGERKEESAWIVKKDYGEIQMRIVNPSDLDISSFILYRKIDNGSYILLQQLNATALQNNTLTILDKFLEKELTYTYKMEAVNINGAVLITSNEITL